MNTRTACVVATLFIALAAGPISAANFVIINGDGPGEGLNDTTPVTPVGGNTGTTLGEQRQIVLQAVADAWATRLVSSVDIVILARFNPMDCGVLGSTGPGTAFMNFPGAPIPNVYYHSSVADSITGTDMNPGQADFFITYNSSWNSVTCPSSFYYGLDGEEPTGTEDLFPVVLHEMGHGLGFASFVNPANGVNFFGAPGVFDYFILDMTTGLHWSEMNNAQRAASAINDGNLVWDGPNATAEAFDTVAVGAMDIEVTTPPAIAGIYAGQGALFGSMPMDEFSGEFELVNTGTATPADGCDPLVGFTPGKIAVIDRGNCEFGLKAYNAENAGAGAVLIANNQGGTALISMLAGVYGDQVTIPVAAISQDDGNIIKAQLPGVSGVFRALERLGLHDSGFPLLYAPSPVNPGSSVSHWDVTAGPDLLMEPFSSIYVFDQLDITPAQLKDIGQQVTGLDSIFSDGFESGDTTSWDGTVP
jgi:hypothetical protein